MSLHSSPDPFCCADIFRGSYVCVSSRREACVEVGPVHNLSLVDSLRVD